MTQPPQHNDLPESQAPKEQETENTGSHPSDTHIRVKAGHEAKRGMFIVVEDGEIIVREDDDPASAT